MARDRLAHLAERDAQAYAQVIEARRRPNSTPAEKLARQIALQHALPGLSSMMTAHVFAFIFRARTSLHSTLIAGEKYPPHGRHVGPRDFIGQRPLRPPDLCWVLVTLMGGKPSSSLLRSSK